MRFTPGALLLPLLAFSLTPVHGENRHLCCHLCFELKWSSAISIFFFSNQKMRGSVNEAGENCSAAPRFIFFFIS